MASSLLFATLLFLPCLASCAFPWPDNVTQHKGYIEVASTVCKYYVQDVIYNVQLRKAH